MCIRDRVDTLMLSSVSDQAVGAVGTANTYISVFIIMFGVISSLSLIHIYAVCKHHHIYQRGSACA